MTGLGYKGCSHAKHMLLAWPCWGWQWRDLYRGDVGRGNGCPHKQLPKLAALVRAVISRPLLELVLTWVC